MEITIKKTVAVCSVITVFVTSLYLIYLSKTIILYLLIATILAIAINPLILRIKKYKIRGIYAILLADFIIFVLIACVLSTIIIPLVNQGISLVQNLPDIIHNILNNQSLINLSYKYHFESNLSQFSNQISSAILGGGGSIILITSSIISKLSSFTIIMVLAFLLQIEGEKIWEAFLSFFKEKDHKFAQEVSAKISKAISGFVSGNLFISLIAGLVTFLTLMILNIPYAFALSALVALFDLIPLIGAAIATIVVGLVALTKGLMIALIAVVIILIYQFTEGHFIQPIVYSKSIKISALIIVVSSVLGGEIGGILGILLAIPIASVLQIVVTEFYLYFKNNQIK